MVRELESFLVVVLSFMPFPCPFLEDEEGENLPQEVEEVLGQTTTTGVYSHG